MNDKMHEALSAISDRHLEEAESYHKRRYPIWLSAAAAVLALALVLSPVLTGIFGSVPAVPTISGTQPAVLPNLAQPQSPHTLQLANLVAAPEYPEMVQKPEGTDYTNDQDAYKQAYNAWLVSQGKQYNQPNHYADSLTEFFSESIRQFLNGEENGAYSPVNVYMALALLAECTDGNSRQQILDLLGLQSMDSLREQVGHVWNAHYCADGQTTLVLGNSLWLSNRYDYHRETLDRLADTYYASAFHGEMGSTEYTNQLRQWLNSQTGGLLGDQIQGIELDPETVFTLASTVFFSAGWESGFSEKNTEEAVFHCADKDLITSFMNKTFDSTYYYGENFGAVKVELTGQNGMWLILPKEGFTVSQILASDEYLKMVQNPNEWEKQYRNIRIILKVPKFDVSCDMDLIDGLKEMGVTDVFDYEISDFTAVTDAKKLYVNAVKHAARVKIDEEGCVGAAFTLMHVYGSSAPSAPPEEVYFTLDHPFLFVVSSRDQLPLFAGVVAQP